MTVATVYERFYTVPRLGARAIDGVLPLSDLGGPFGFDVHAAIAFDHLVDVYAPDAIIETGSHVGDTTEYLARTYPHLPVHSCDLNPVHVDVARRRTRRLPNCHVTREDSRDLVRRAVGRYARPLFFLDAHWNSDWPLHDELSLITHGIVVIDDFDIGDPAFGFDEYHGVRCGPEMLFARCLDEVVYVNGPDEVFPLPCLQLGRRAGRGYLVRAAPDLLASSRYFRAIRRSPA